MASTGVTTPAYVRSPQEPGREDPVALVAIWIELLAGQTRSEHAGFGDEAQTRHFTRDQRRDERIEDFESELLRLGRGCAVPHLADQQQRATGSQNPRELPRRLLNVVDVIERVEAADDVEVRIGERDPLGAGVRVVHPVARDAQLPVAVDQRVQADALGGHVSPLERTSWSAPHIEDALALVEGLRQPEVLGEVVPVVPAREPALDRRSITPVGHLGPGLPTACW